MAYALKPFVPHLQVLAVSCPDGQGLLDYLASLYQLMEPLPRKLIWQTDGRPMSGDIGDGTTRATVLSGRKSIKGTITRLCPTGRRHKSAYYC